MVRVLHKISSRQIKDKRGSTALLGIIVDRDLADVCTRVLYTTYLAPLLYREMVGLRDSPDSVENLKFRRFVFVDTIMHSIGPRVKEKV